MDRMNHPSYISGRSESPAFAEPLTDLVPSALHPDRALGSSKGELVDALTYAYPHCDFIELDARRSIDAGPLTGFDPVIDSYLPFLNSERSSTHYPVETSADYFPSGHSYTSYPVAFSSNPFTAMSFSHPPLMSSGFLNHTSASRALNDRERAWNYPTSSRQLIEPSSGREVLPEPYDTWPRLPAYSHDPVEATPPATPSLYASTEPSTSSTLRRSSRIRMAASSGLNNIPDTSIASSSRNQGSTPTASSSRRRTRRMTLSFQTPNIGSSLSEARRIKERDDKRVTRREERAEMVKVRRLLREQIEDGSGAGGRDMVLRG